MMSKQSTENWGARTLPPANAATLTFDNIPAVRSNPNRFAKPWEIPKWVARFGMALLAAAAIWGGAEASIRTSTGRHAHEILGDLVELGMAELDRKPQAFNSKNP